MISRAAPTSSGIAIVVDAVYDKVLSRVVDLARAIALGPPEDPRSFMGPLSSESRRYKVPGYIEVGKGNGRLMCGGQSLPGSGHFAAPAVIADVAPTAWIAQEEIFGPVLSFIKAKRWDALVDVHPFGGFNMSGTDSKAAGRDYLLLFMQGKSVSEAL